MKFSWQTVLMATMMTLGFHMAYAQTVESDIYTCDSTVAGFEHFTLTQSVTTVAETTKTVYKLKTGLVGEEIWDQYGTPLVSDESPVFQSVFMRVVTITPTPDPEADPSLPPQPPTSYKEKYFLSVSVNRTGTGSISVNADLAPIDCRKPEVVIP